MNSADVDDDNDGLIEIYNLDMFDDIRLNLAGTSYNSVTTGGPTSATANCPTDPDSDTVFLCGYELMTNLDFALAASYASGTVNTTWCPVPSTCIGTTQAGFPGIGPGGFTGIFEGNGNSISNFYSRNNANIGLFANNSGTIRNIAVVDANVFGGGGTDRIGGLVGNNAGAIIASSASGSADGGAGNFDEVGGLAGRNAGTIIASYATGDGDDATTSDADGGDGASDYVGGLVGWNNGGSIIASYATGSANGGDGILDRAGGLVGRNETTIIASYATGSADGGDGDGDIVGGLVGLAQSGTITAGYAIGDAEGGDGISDEVGSMAGSVSAGTITATYGFGTADGESVGSAGSTKPTIAGVAITSATELNASGDPTTGDAGTSLWWNEASSTGAGAWRLRHGPTPRTPPWSTATMTVLVLVAWTTLRAAMPRDFS